eukprot:m.73382 g.73382  ORF g.73382 m.73382 type:complete len:57 (-) comp14326_c1_seq7:52-222(-)
MAVAVKSLPAFEGFVTNVTWRNIELHDVAQAIMINEAGQSLSRQGKRAKVLWGECF